MKKYNRLLVHVYHVFEIKGNITLTNISAVVEPIKHNHYIHSRKMHITSTFGRRFFNKQKEFFNLIID